MEEKVEATGAKEVVTGSIEHKLRMLYRLQCIDTKIDKIRIIRGELPLEVRDLEDEIGMLKTRISNYSEANKEHTIKMEEFKKQITESQSSIKKYKEQLMNVRNNREYESLNKEIEFQDLEIQLAEKRIRENQASIQMNDEEIQKCQKELSLVEKEVEVKRAELNDIISETEIEEKRLLEKRAECESYIDERLLTAYSRIRNNARNGLAVVTIERGACSGCFNKIPPQHQLDICNYQKIIVCEFCGRIMVDSGIVHEEEEHN
ncbi:MAG: hypothetical protein PHR53_03730 [Bacteroidales bacterium]|nr:hypothetical protein [Bacteroidales bacterium]